ncbi:MAG: hypothetical protein F7C82_06915, partial [Desulfurococcales archaeon]|nr:hypothetical protein [Desulfurococcales archaeon]
ALWVGGKAERSSGEKEGSCPSLPKTLPVTATLHLSADETAAWDPLIRWQPLTKSGDIHAYKLYEQDPKHPRLEPTVSEDDEGGILGVMISEATKWSMALFLPFLVADSVSSILGGYSVGGAIVSGVKRIAKGMVATRLFRGGVMRGSTVSISDPLKRAVAEEEKQLLKKLEYERLKAIKERDRLKAAYIVTAIAAYKRAKKSRTLPRPEFKRGWKFIKFSRDNAESRRARTEFYQAVSRIFPEEATLLQRLSEDKRVSITRTQAERIVDDYSRSNRVGFLMASRDAGSLGRAILRGNAEIDERMLRGYVRPDSQASQYNIAIASHIRRGVLGKRYETTRPFGFSSLAKSTASRSLVNRAGFEIQQRYGSAKIVKGLSNDSDGLVETERIHSGYEHAANLKLTKDGLEGTIANNPSGGELGRTITIDTGIYEEPFVDVSDEEVKKAEADLIGFVRDFYRTKERQNHPIGRHTGGKGHDWFWEVV